MPCSSASGIGRFHNAAIVITPDRCRAGLAEIPEDAAVVLDPAVPSAWVDAIAEHWRRRPALLTMVLSTVTAFEPAVPRALAAWIRRRAPLPDEAGPLETAPLEIAPLEIALTEALANAVIHGNLGLPGLDDHGGDLAAHHAAVAVALRDPERSVLPVRLSVRRAGGLMIVHIDDCGQGFAAPGGAALSRAARCAAGRQPLSGRGLMIMRSLCRCRFSRGGRRVSLGLPLRAGKGEAAP